MAGLSGIMELEDVEVIELSVLRKGLIITLNVKTVDRLDYLFKPQSF
jgi:hypothetical protein